MLQAGVYIAPSAYESWFITDALSYEDLDYTIAAAEIVAKKHLKIKQKLRDEHAQKLDTIWGIFIIPCLHHLVFDTSVLHFLFHLSLICFPFSRLLGVKIAFIFHPFFVFAHPFFFGLFSFLFSSRLL
jgi:hypothetical protein